MHLASSTIRDRVGDVDMMTASPANAGQISSCFTSQNKAYIIVHDAYYYRLLSAPGNLLMPALAK